MNVADEEARCTAQHFDTDGLPAACDKEPVWALSHSNGQVVHLCEYHIECFWGMWLSFREAVRDVWPSFVARRL